MTKNKPTQYMHRMCNIKICCFVPGITTAISQLNAGKRPASTKRLTILLTPGDWRNLGMSKTAQRKQMLVFSVIIRFRTAIAKKITNHNLCTEYELHNKPHALFVRWAYHY